MGAFYYPQMFSCILEHVTKETSGNIAVLLWLEQINDSAMDMPYYNVSFFSL